MNKIKVGHFTPDGGLINLPVGFVPDYFTMHQVGGGDAAVVQTIWFKAQETDEASGSQEGWANTEGTTDVLADAGGITAYDSGSQKPALCPWTLEATALLDKAGTSVTVVARSATVTGTYAIPSTSSDTDRDAIFECVTAGTTGSTEPTWPDAIGEQVTDGTTVWERVDAPVTRQGYQGVVIAGALMTNSQEMYYLALQADQSIDHGDVDGWTGGIDPDAN